MVYSGLIGVLLRLAILGAFGSEVEVALPVAKTPEISASAATGIEVIVAFDRKREELRLREILERLAVRSREIRSVQVRFKRVHTSRQWGDTVDHGEGRLVLDKSKFGVMECMCRSEPGAAAPARQIGLWTRESYSSIDTDNHFAYIFPREGEDLGWMPSDLKLPFFFDTDVGEMQKSYRFRTREVDADNVYPPRDTTQGKKRRHLGHRLACTGPRDVESDHPLAGPRPWRSRRLSGTEHQDQPSDP